MKKFNIRVYGLLMNEQGEVLLSDEQYKGQRFTKFPGGGLEFGEGTKDCLIREFKEELGIEIQVGELFYLTDSFQVSSFDKESQVVSVYYRISTQEFHKIHTVLQPFENLNGKQEVQRWKKCSEIQENDVTFPIDRKVVKLLKDLTV